jgi:toxin ParE1/3/4
MTFRIEFSHEAREDLRQIREYISVDLDNESSAAKVVGNIVNNIGRLADYPKIGAPLVSRISEETDYRYLVCGNYNVFYRIETQTVKVVRILNARRNFMTILFGKDF